MRPAIAAALVVAVRLAVAAAAIAQVVDEEPLPEAVPLRIEIGGGAGQTVAHPEVSALMSVPLGPQTSFELAAGWLPRVLYDVEHVLVQAQFRMPFRAHLRSRKSLLIGVTRLSSRKRNPDDSGFWGADDRVVFPHAGVSLQWPIGRHADFRFDAQGLFTLDRELPLLPRAAGTFVWHP